MRRSSLRTDFTAPPRPTRCTNPFSFGERKVCLPIKSSPRRNIPPGTRLDGQADLPFAEAERVGAACGARRRGEVCPQARTPHPCAGAAQQRLVLLALDHTAVCHASLHGGGALEAKAPRGAGGLVGCLGGV